MTKSGKKHFRSIFFSRLYLMLKLLTTFITFLLLTIRACIKSQFCKRVYLFIVKDYKTVQLKK